MDTKQMTYFRAIAETGSISAAAKKLNMTQPPLSAQMKLLEDEIGTVLFLRGPRTIQLTEAGTLLYRRCCSILDLTQNTLRELDDLKRGRTGTLRLGVVSSVTDLAIRRWITPYAGRYPDIHFEISEGNTYELIDRLHAHSIDAAFVRTPFDMDERLESITVEREPLLAAGDEKFFPDAGSVSASGLAQMPLLVYRRWTDVLDRYFDDHHLRHRYYFISDDARTVLSCAVSGLGVAIVPASARQQLYVGDLQFHPIAGGLSETDICLITDKGGYLPTAASLFLKMITDYRRNPSAPVLQ